MAMYKPHISEFGMLCLFVNTNMRSVYSCFKVFTCDMHLRVVQVLYVLVDYEMLDKIANPRHVLQVLSVA